MDNGLIIDAVFALVLICGTAFGAKRGLLRSFMALAAVVLALLGASLLTDALADPVTELLAPRAEQSVQEWFDEARLSDGEEPSSGAADGEIADASGLLRRLLRFDLDGAVRDSLRSAAQDAALAAVRSLLAGVVRTLLFVLGFLALTLLLRLLTRGLDRVFCLPGLRTVNALGGAALGLTESALLLFLACYLAPRLGVAAFAENEEGTHLLRFFMNNTPRSLIAALTIHGNP